MKIKLAVLENDKIYLDRLVSAFNVKYSDKLEIYSFTDMDVAIPALDTNKIDVFLVNEFFNIDKKDIPQRCGFAYLVDTKDIETVRNESVIFKFQKADMIYKNILSIYSEASSEITGIHLDENDNARVISFLSPSGGTGCSTAAAACAINFASKGKKVLFLDLEKFGNSDIFFHGEGTSDFSDVVYAIKSKKVNLSLKLESTVKQDPTTGVYYYSAAKTALDVAELNSTEIKKLITDIRLFGGYDYIILDFDFALDKGTLEVLNESNRIVFVSDGSVISNNKFERSIEALLLIEQQYDYKLILRSGILYNRVSSHNSNKPNIEDMKEFGGIKRYEGYTIDRMLKELSTLNVFDSMQ